MTTNVHLPLSILLDHVAKFIGDRLTWNALFSANKELYDLSRNSISMSPPWPHVRLRVADGRAWSVAFGKDFIACGTERGRIQIWSTRDGKGLLLRDHHKRRVHSTIIHENLLITGSEDGSVLIWKTHEWAHGKSLQVHKGSVSCICTWTDTPNKIRIAAACGDRKIRVYSVSTYTLEFAQDPHLPILDILNRGPVHAICKVGDYLVTGGLDEQLLAWDLDDHQQGSSSNTELTSRAVQLLNLGDIRSFDVKNDTLAVACGKIIVLFNKGLRKTKVLKGHHSNIRSLAFSPDGELLASACSDGSIRLWKISNEFCIEKWEAHDGFIVCAIAFQGSKLVSVGSDGTIAIWGVPRS